MAKVSPILPPMELYKQYKESQGLTALHEARHGLRCLAGSDAEGFELPLYLGPVIPFVYHDPSGRPTNNVRYRMLVPQPGMKYWQPKGSGDFGPYLPQGLWKWEDVFASPNVPILIPEGEVKAIIAQDYLESVAVMAIAGVSMWRALLERGDIIWKGRTVVVAFDHDDGQEPGHYKPQVELQLGRFCEALIAKGAIVYCTQLGVLAKRQKLEGKMGLDDYLRAGGDPALLVTELASPPKGCELLASMFDRNVIVTLPKPVIWDRVLGHSYQFKPFYDLNVNKIRIDPVPGKPPREVMVAHEFVKRVDRPEATQFVMDPGLPYGYLAERKLINLCKPFRICDPKLVRKEYIAAFGRLVKVLAGEFPVQISQWLAHYIRRPWERTTQAVLITTPLMGIGKSLLGEIIGALVGRDHYAEVTHEALKAQFNENLEGKSWMLWNEVSLRFGVAESWLRNLLSQETVRIEVKGGACYEVNNIRRYMMNTNDHTAIRIAQGNRRVWVCHPKLVRGEELEWKSWLWDNVIKPWREDTEAWLSSVRAWLDAVDLCDYDPMSEVINGEAALELMEHSMTATQSAAAEIMRMWADSGEDLLVVSSGVRKMYDEVFKHISSQVKVEGGRHGRRAVRSAGFKQDYIAYGNKTRYLDFEADKAGTPTYIGKLVGSELKKIADRQLLWVMEACSHLKPGTPGT